MGGAGRASPPEKPRYHVRRLSLQAKHGEEFGHDRSPDKSR